MWGTHIQEGFPLVATHKSGEMLRIFNSFIMSTSPVVHYTPHHYDPKHHRSLSFAPCYPHPPHTHTQTHTGTYSHTPKHPYTHIPMHTYIHTPCIFPLSMICPAHTCAPSNSVPPTLALCPHSPTTLPRSNLRCTHTCPSLCPSHTCPPHTFPALPRSHLFCVLFGWRVACASADTLIHAYAYINTHSLYLFDTLSLCPAHASPLRVLFGWRVSRASASAFSFFNNAACTIAAT